MDERTQPAFAAGDLLAGKYRVERVLGQGGMGIVLAAKHEQLNKDVAIKLLLSGAMGQTDVVGRFMREARAAVSLRSEHVARVLDVGHLEDGRPFIVMERLVGKDLGEVIDAGPPLPVATAVEYVVQACEAIAEAHAAGIVHRDLKPRNLFLTHTVDGRPLVKVLDFGISKIDPQLAPGEMQLTRTTEVIGSPSYMSPEQLRSARNVDVRTDIWALGVIVYELLTQRVPFYAETITELVLVVATEPAPPVRSLRADVPEALEAVVARCLQKAPEYRFQSVVELVQALEPFIHTVQATATDRVRAVVSQSGRLLPPAPPSSSGALVPAPSPSSRVNVHGGTSVAWGETQSMTGSPPAAAPPPAVARGGLVAALVIFGVVLAGGAGGAVYFATKARAAAAAPVQASEGASLPLPSGRKDLPPVPATSAAPAPVDKDPPLASTLPATRKPSGTATAKPSAPKPSPKPVAKGDDLSNIERR